MLQRTRRSRLPARMMAGLMTAGLLFGPAGPASAATTVSITAHTVVLANQQTWIQGAVSGNSVGATLRILKYSSGTWVYAAQTTVNSSQKYAVKVTVASGGNTFMAKAYGPNVATGYSKSVKIYGVTARGMILYKTNEYRKSQGRPALKGLSGLDQVAQNWSQHMADADVFEHNPSFSAQYPAGWKYAAENIAAGQTPETVVNAWINSAPHRANLLCTCSHIGIGYAVNAASMYKRYFTQNFALY